MLNLSCSLALVAGAILCASVASAAIVPAKPLSMSVNVEAGEYVVRGKSVKVAQNTILHVAPPEKLLVKGEVLRMVDEQPHMYSKGNVLKETIGPIDTTIRMPKILDPDSVVLRSQKDGGVIYEEGKDYFLDRTWGGLCRTEDSKISFEQEVYADYAVFRQRIDLVQVFSDGAVSIKRGESVAANPEIPEPDDGAAALANIYVPFRTESISAENIYQLPSEDITWRDFITVKGADKVSKTRRTLADGKQVTIVCWGDSVTQGASARPHDQCYVDVFSRSIKAAYPNASINVINAGIGGSNTDTRRDGFEKEVLSFEPDLITVEFVNDVGKSSEKILSNYAEFMRRAREKNPDVEFIVITPHFTMPEWMGNFSNAVSAMREAADINGAALADTTHIWANLRNVGIPYEALLANAINHPNNLGHEFFAETLMAILGPEFK